MDLFDCLVVSPISVGFIQVLLKKLQNQGAQGPKVFVGEEKRVVVLD